MPRLVLDRTLQIMAVVSELLNVSMVPYGAPAILASVQNSAGSHAHTFGLLAVVLEVLGEEGPDGGDIAIHCTINVDVFDPIALQRPEPGSAFSNCTTMSTA